MARAPGAITRAGQWVQPPPTSGCGGPGGVHGAVDRAPCVGGMRARATVGFTGGFPRGFTGGFTGGFPRGFIGGFAAGLTPCPAVRAFVQVNRQVQPGPVHRHLFLESGRGPSSFSPPGAADAAARSRRLLPACGAAVDSTHPTLPSEMYGNELDAQIFTHGQPPDVVRELQAVGDRGGAGPEGGEEGSRPAAARPYVVCTPGGWFRAVHAVASAGGAYGPGPWTTSS